MKRLGTIGILLAATLLAGCVTGRSELKLASATAPPQAGSPEAKVAAPPAMPPNGKIIFIRTVADDRVFEEKPRSPATPTIDGGLAKATPELKARAFGRKRNGYGHAMGDIVLDEGQTVSGVVRDSVVVALKDAGFQVADGAAAPQGAIVVDVHIKQFWEYYTPGFWAVSVTANVEAEIDRAGSTAPVMIKVERVDRGQMITEHGVRTNMDAAMVTFRRQLQEKASAAQF